MKPYYEFMEREILFREAVIGTLINEKYSQENIEDEYCYACKQRHPDIDCSKCEKEITLQKPPQENKVIGQK